MPSSTMDGGLRGDYEVNMNGEPCARKPACTVREGTERKGQFVCTSLSVYLTPAEALSTFVKEYKLYTVLLPSNINARVEQCIK
jgi:hypothetical protein